MANFKAREMAKVVTVVLKRDGSFHMASEKVSLADAERWADEGFQVYRIATLGMRWAVNQLPSGKIFTDDMIPPQVNEETNRTFSTLLLINKEGE